MTQYLITSVTHRTDGINEVTRETINDPGAAMAKVFELAKGITTHTKAIDGVVVMTDEQLNTIKRVTIEAGFTAYKPTATQPTESKPESAE
ncbi:MAG: hypothetical protein MJ074_07205 [Oscillospiraceae bacterium]|nr:hypothetical protein [Oscillospiraceae bacterium]